MDAVREPMLDINELIRRERAVNAAGRRQPGQTNYTLNPTKNQLLWKWTIVGLVLNRTIGAGIFAQPSNVLYLTGSPAVAVVLWAVGGLIILFITVSWLELARTIPQEFIPQWGRHAWAAQTGGDKNYLEYIYTKPHQWISCVFAITFILFGNLAANAIQFGIYMQKVISPHCHEGDDCYNRGSVIAWAFLVLIFCSLFNLVTRKLFIWVINIFALAKFVLVLATALIGIAYGTAHGHGCSNLSVDNRGAGGEVGDIALALFYSMYSYTGFEQPFYVLSEIDRPRKYFVKYVLVSLGIVLILFPLMNVGYFCVVPYTGSDSVPENMALAFFGKIASNGDRTADTTETERGVSALLAFVILGTIMAQTFTGTLVKQEIGKEAIIPFSEFVARGTKSLWAKYKECRSKDNVSDSPTPGNQDFIKNHPEYVPFGATVLHLLFAMLMVGLFGGAISRPSTAYRLLTYLRVFAVIVVLGLLTVLGLLYLKFDSWLRRPRGKGVPTPAIPDIPDIPDGTHGTTQQGGNDKRRWHELREGNFIPPLDPLMNVLACLALAFLAFGTFAPPTQVRESEQRLPYWSYPLIGWMVTFLGTLWWAGLKLKQWWYQSIVLVEREAEVVAEGHDAVIKGEKFRFINVELIDVPDWFWGRS